MTAPSLKQIDLAELSYALAHIATHPAFSNFEIRGSILTISFANVNNPIANAKHFQGEKTMSGWYDCLRMARDWCIKNPNYNPAIAAMDVVNHPAKTSIFDVPAEAYINPVNCVGVMGAGLALEFRRRYPQMFRAYQEACHKGQVQLGKVWTYENKTPPQQVLDIAHKQNLPVPNYLYVPYIICFPTKHHWQEQSTLDAIEAGMESMMNEVRRRNIQSIALPAVGCGLGELNYRDVYPIMVDVIMQFTRDYPMQIHFLPPHEKTVST